MISYTLYQAAFNQRPGKPSLILAAQVAQRCADAVADLRVPYTRAFEIVCGREVTNKSRAISYIIFDVTHSASPDASRLRMAARLLAKEARS